MLRGHVVCQRGGRRRVFSTINAEAARRYGPRVRPSPLAYVTGHKPRGSNGFLPERGAQGKAWTRVSTEPLLKPGSSPSRDLAKARTLLGGTWGLPEGPGVPSWEPRTCMHRGPVPYCGGLDPMMHPGMYYLPLPRGAFRPAHVVGSGAVLRVTWRCCTCTSPSYYRRGYP
jgi:hypothetical protein